VTNAAIEAYETEWKKQQELRRDEARANAAYETAVTRRDQTRPESETWKQHDSEVQQCMRAAWAATEAVRGHQQQVMERDGLQGRSLQTNLPPDEYGKLADSRGEKLVQGYEVLEVAKDLAQLVAGHASALPLIDPPTAQAAGQAAAYVIDHAGVMVDYTAGTVRAALDQKGQSAPDGLGAGRLPPPLTEPDRELARLQAEVAEARKQLDVAQQQEQAFLLLPAGTQAEGRGHRLPQEIQRELDHKTAERDAYARQHDPRIAAGFDKADQLADERSKQIKEAVEKNMESRFMTPERQELLQERAQAELSRIETERQAAREAAVEQQLQQQRLEHQRSWEREPVR
jgi:hypothetical protein